MSAPRCNICDEVLSTLTHPPSGQQRDCPEADPMTDRPKERVARELQAWIYHCPKCSDLGIEDRGPPQLCGMCHARGEEAYLVTQEIHDRRILQALERDGGCVGFYGATTDREQEGFPVWLRPRRPSTETDAPGEGPETEGGTLAGTRRGERAARMQNVMDMFCPDPDDGPGEGEDEKPPHPVDWAAYHEWLERERGYEYALDEARHMAQEMHADGVDEPTATLCDLVIEAHIQRHQSRSRPEPTVEGGLLRAGPNILLAALLRDMAEESARGDEAELLDEAARRLRGCPDGERVEGWAAVSQEGLEYVGVDKEDVRRKGDHLAKHHGDWSFRLEPVLIIHDKPTQGEG